MIELLLSAARPEAVSEAPSWLPTIIAGVLTVLTGGGLVAFFRARPEGSKILVDAAQGAVIVQTGVIESLRAELAAARGEIAELRGNMHELNLMRNRIRELEQDNEILSAENTVLKSRQNLLERENMTLSNRVAELERSR